MIARSNFNVGCSTNCDKRYCKQATNRRYFILGLYVKSVLLPAKHPVWRVTKMFNF